MGHGGGIADEVLVILVVVNAHIERLQGVDVILLARAVFINHASTLKINLA